MAFADYFSRNATSAAQLLQNYSDAGLQATLEKQCVGIAFDKLGASQREGLASLDLLVRLLARLYPTMALLPLDTSAELAAKSLEKLALEINPKLTLSRDQQSVTLCIVVGGTPVRVANGAKRIYMGSDGWLAKLSQRKPCGCRNTKNPFGAGVAACLAAANAFRVIFKDQLARPTQDGELTLSALDLNVSLPSFPNPPFRATDVGSVHVCGLGAIGHGFLWAVKNGAITGEFELIDPDSIDLGNLQRYAMTVRADETKEKVLLAVSQLEAPGRIARGHKMTWEQFLASESVWRHERIVVAVDSAEDRISIQASLPKWVVNGWTRPGIAAFSRHAAFDDPNACLACLYVPRGTVKSEDERILSELRLERVMLMEVRRLLDTGEGIKVEFLQILGNVNGIPLEKLMPFEGQPLRSLYVRGFCSGALLEFRGDGSKSQAEVPMAFQSALAGILLAVELILAKSPSRAKLPNFCAIDLLRKFPRYPMQRHLRETDEYCMCGDKDFQEIYRAKYSRA